MTNDTYFDTNKALWNQKTPIHIASDFYDHQSFLDGKSSLNEIELPLLGDVAGKSILHLQCHFGQDTLSLARMGAHVTGVDFSDVAIAQATDTAEQLGLNATFICSNIFDLPMALNETYDVIFMSYGTICWYPDMKAWAALIRQYLKPNGTFVFADFHPCIWMLDNHFKWIQYSYFNKEMIAETESGTYADMDAPIKTTSITWNHDLSEVIQALLGQGLTLLDFQEYDYSPYNIFPDAVEISPKRFQINGLQGKIPMVYSLKMVNNKC